MCTQDFNHPVYTCRNPDLLVWGSCGLQGGAGRPASGCPSLYILLLAGPILAPLASGLPLLPASFHPIHYCLEARRWRQKQRGQCNEHLSGDRLAYHPGARASIITEMAPKTKPAEIFSSSQAYNGRCHAANRALFSSQCSHVLESFGNCALGGALHQIM